MGDLGSIPWLGRSPGESKSCPLQDSSMQNPIHGVAELGMTEWLSLSMDTVKFYICTYTYMYIYVPICMNKVSVQFSLSVVSDSLWPHGLQHAKPPCPSPTPGVYSNSCPSSQWCHPTISSSIIPFSSHLQSFPASGSFQMSQLFTSGGQSIGVSTSTSVIYCYIYED